jgi:hypothetical protein
MDAGVSAMQGMEPARDPSDEVIELAPAAGLRVCNNVSLYLPLLYRYSMARAHASAPQGYRNLYVGRTLVPPSAATGVKLGGVSAPSAPPWRPGGNVQLGRCLPYGMTRRVGVLHVAQLIPGALRILPACQGCVPADCKLP